MKSVVRIAAASTWSSVALLAAVACDRTTEPVARLKPTAPSFAVAVAQMQHIPLAQDPADGAYILDRVCDVFIGEPVIEAGGEVPQRYEHQVVVDVPANARVKVVRPEGESKTFVCDAVDRDADGNAILDINGNEQPVIDPNTAHAAKGDAVQINTTGVTLDLNGYSITVSPAFGTAAGFENIGVVLAGDDVTLTNSAVAGPDGSGVSRISGFGHNIDVEAVRPKVLGKRFDAAGQPDVAGQYFNLETEGGMGIRLSVGPMQFDQVKSVNLDPVDGQGFEARRLTSGILTVTNSYFEGAAEGVFLREVSGVTFRNNTVKSSGGAAISTRQASSTTSTRPILIQDNVILQSATGIIWGRESTANSNLKIERNTVSASGCGIGISSRRNTTWPYGANTNNSFPALLSATGAANTVTASPTTCRFND